MISRPSKDEYFLEIAKAVGLRASCSRKRFGAIIVKNDAIVSTGYNGGPRGSVNCHEVGCLRTAQNLPHYASYDESCPAVHAEENCIVNAARNGAAVLDGVLYIQGVTPEGVLTESKPCHRCRRALINSGVREVITRDAQGDLIHYHVHDWAASESREYIEKYEAAVKKTGAEVKSRLLNP